jgi:hypothetical protein
VTIKFLGRRASLFFAVLLGLSLIGPAWADDGDEKKKVETSNEVDCEDKDNAALPECRPANSPVVIQESAPPQSESAPSSPAPSQTGSGLYTGPATDLVFKLSDAGKEATQYEFKDGADDKGTWARGRYERRDDTGSADTLGPRVIDHTVYVTKTADQAKQLFKDETAKNDRFPEQVARDERKGSFKFDISNMVEQTSAISACNDCDGKDQLMLHHRIVQQKNNIVSVLYLYGRDKRGSEEIVTQKIAELQWAYLVSQRIAN